MNELTLDSNKPLEVYVGSLPCRSCGKPIGTGRAYTIQITDKKDGGIIRRHISCSEPTTVKAETTFAQDIASLYSDDD